MGKNDFQKTDYRYIVLGIERKKAKFFVVDKGAVQEIWQFEQSNMPKEAKGSYPSGIAYPRVDKIARHVDVHVDRFLKKIAKSAILLSKNFPENIIVLTGRKELFSKIKKFLPERVLAKIKAEIKADLDMSNNEILLKSKNSLVA
jgi:hypothetical protein